MFVRKKMQVQKSFRIDENVERDLGLLAKITERSQNDLVNVALEELLQDNRMYFLKVAIVEHFERELENGEEIEPFEMGGLRVEMSYIGDNKLKVRSITKFDNFEREFESDICDDFENYLMELSFYIDPNAEDTLAYLDGRTDYRDYVKIRKK